MAPSEPSPAPFDGFLVIDKPAGWTSHDVVARVRRILGQRQVGHAGTLDPAATGVLPIAAGAATKVVEYLAEASKSYLAEVTFGIRTDSFDGDGRVTHVSDATGLTLTAIESALPGLTGVLQQLPPMWSAVKIEGRRLYEHARRGEEVVRAPREVTVFSLEALDWEPPTVRLFVDCSKGTYVRSIASDLGERLGVGAYLSNLVRVRTGPFSICDSITMAELERAELPWSWPELAHHPDVVLEDWSTLLLDEPTGRSWMYGIAVPADSRADGHCRVYDHQGDWLGIGRAADDGDRWQPLKVVRAA